MTFSSGPAKKTINPTDIARLAPRSSPERRAPLIGLCFPPKGRFTYQPVKSRAAKLLGIDNGESPSENIIEEYEKKSIGKKGTLQNAACMRALVDFRRENDVHGITLEEFGLGPLQVGPALLSCWVDGLYFVNDKPTVFFFDPRTSNTKLDEYGISFMLSLVHFATRARHFDLYDIEIGILQVKKRIKDQSIDGDQTERRVIEAVYLDGGPLYSLKDMHEMVDSLFVEFERVQREHFGK